MRSLIQASSLPKGWQWSVYDDKDPTFGSYQADLYSPVGCRAGEVRKPAFPKSSKYYTHTWDEEGCGGENSVHDSAEEAMAFVEAAINRQGFHMECDLDCSDDGCVETAAELAGDLVDDLDEKSRVAVLKIVEAMLGPKRYREWREENDV